MNRTALGLAVGAGYLLGRTKKAKMALAVGSLVAGKKLNLTPRALGDLLQQQLRDNPQFKEIGDQLREDLRGVGKAASGAMAERQMNALAERLHGRTTEVRDRLSGAVPGTGSDEEDEEPRDDAEDTEDTEDTSEGRQEERPRKKAAEKETGDDEETSQARREERPRKKAAEKTPPKKASAKKAAPKAPAKKTAVARKTAAKKTAAAGGGSRGGRSRQSKGGDDR
ncbi:DNA primase [Streptomyces sp. NPDC007905]|uniref:DNA primase n=1 Tax=Streptomyces sp. NPDC007905 TaxID=3364788 RepID=UPI0036EAFCEE